jgi:adenylate cyclase
MCTDVGEHWNYDSFVSSTLRWVRKQFERLLNVGSYYAEDELKSGKRRVIVGAFWVSLPFIMLSSALDFAEGMYLLALVVGIQAAFHLGSLVFIGLRPAWIAPILTVVFAYDIVAEILSSYLYGGLVPSGGTIVWALIAVLAALVVFSLRSAMIWFAVFAASIILTTAMTGFVEPTYILEDVASDLALNLIGATFLTFVVMAYFVRQRDRFQTQSDDLLHNMLPQPIAARLKLDSSPIADNPTDVSVLFADIVNFTPLSDSMSAPDLINLLNEVFRTIDDLVDDLGLEKIKTIGDEYMVAAGVPVHDPNHATNIADLALEIRDTMSNATFQGHDLQMRIGINSGPVIAGVIGTKKFAYDLWGATVNTASRMESTGIPGKIQVTTQTYELLRDKFVLKQRDAVEVKGLGTMNTHILLNRQPGEPRP